MAKWKPVNNFPRKVNNAAYGELCWCCCCCCWNLHAPRKFWRRVIFRWRGGKCVACLTTCTCFQLRNISWVLTLSLLRTGYCFPSTNDFVFYFFFLHQISLYPIINEETSKYFQCHLQTGFCILTFPQIKEIQFSLYHLIWMLFNPPLPIVSVSSNFVSKTYFLRPCHMHTHLDVLCAMLCFMLC